MNEENGLMDQTQLAEDVSRKIRMDFIDKFLVKPLDPIKVKKEFSKPVSEKKPEKDENGVEAIDYDNVETEVKEVESDFRKGVVLKVPFRYRQAMYDEKWPNMPIHIGDVIIFNAKAAMYFDLLKDTMIIDQYAVIGTEETVSENK